MPSLLKVTTSLLIRSISGIWQIHQSIYREYCSETPKLWCHHQVSTLAKRCWYADALSHYASLKAPEIPLDITINHVHITPHRKTEFQTLIQDDLLLHSLAETIIAGWPDNINDVPHALCPYHGHRNALTVEDGLSLWGEALIIPPLGKGEDPPSNTRRTHGNQQVPKQSHTLCILAWNQLRHQACSCWIMPNMPISPPHRKPWQPTSANTIPGITHGNSSALTTYTLTDLNN